MEDFKRESETTEFIKVSDTKMKYINLTFQKVSAKMYDYNCDIKLKVGTETFKAHRDVLAEASDYFDAMFSHNMLEKEQDVIELKGISPRGFTAMMEYFYHGHVTVEPDNIEDVIEAARFFHIDWLVNVSFRFLQQYLTVDNYHMVLHLADKYCLSELQSYIYGFISHYFTELAEKDQLRHLSYEFVLRLLAEDRYINATEGCILKAVQQWVAHDIEKREQHLAELLQFIRYALLDQEEFDLLTEDVLKHLELKHLIEEAREYINNPTKQCILATPNTDARGSQPFLILYSGIEDENVMHYKIPGMCDYLSEVVDTSFLQVVFEFSSVAVLGNFLFVAGGYGNEMCSSSAFYRYDPRNRSWAQLSSMRQSRVSFALCPSKDGLYAVTGIDHIVNEGRDQEIILDTVEFYDPADNLWHFVPALPFGCFNTGSAILDDRLFVTGGITSDPEDNVPVNYVHVYDPLSKEWMPLAQMFVERHSHAVVGLDRKLYVFGGFTSGLDTMSFDSCLENEVYNLDTKQWTLLRMTPLQYGHIYSCSTVIDNQIYVLGGNSVSRFIHRYNKETQELEPGELCENYVHKLLSLNVAFPEDML